MNLILNKDITLLNSKDYQGYTALHLASYNQHDDAVKELLHRGANIYLLNNDCDLALHLAAKNGNLQILNRLLDHDENISINYPNIMGETALHIAVHNEHLSVIETLLKRGASLTILDQNKFTPLSLAEHKKNDAVLQLINKYQKSSNRYNLFSDNRYNQISNNQFNKSTKYGQHFHVTRRRNKY